MKEWILVIILLLMPALFLIYSYNLSINYLKPYFYKKIYNECMKINTTEDMHEKVAYCAVKAKRKVDKL